MILRIPAAALRPLRWLLLPLLLVVLVGCVLEAAGLWLLQHKRRLVGPSRYWRGWFAWHPVRVDFGSDAGGLTLLWLERLERRIGGPFDLIEHRRRTGTPA